MPVTSKYIAKPLWPELGESFYDPVQPASFPKAVLRYRNQEWAERIGLGELSPEEWQKSFWGFEPLPENLPQPLALRYHGHQFLHYNPDLGDGRGFVYAQVQHGASQKNLDLGTKGSGQTPWSRQGDGRLTLKGAVREALATSFLEAVGVNTSKTFSIFETGEHLQRGDEPSPTRSAVLTRLSHGHVRIGTFQRLAHLKDKNGIENLLNFCIRHYSPTADTEEILRSAQNEAPPAVGFFHNVCRATAKTTARWMMAGFVHGVLNTDNINITGESFDYGPYRFLPYYDTQFVAAYFDREGLYAFGRQPYIMIWNLQQLMECLSLVCPDRDKLEDGIAIFQEEFSSETFRFFLQRLNLSDDSLENTEKLFLATLQFLEKSGMPFEHFFFDWNGGMNSEDRARNSDRQNFYKGPEFEEFLRALKPMTCNNTAVLADGYFKRPEPAHLIIDEIEKIWNAIDTKDDWSLFNHKLRDLEKLKSLNFS